ncbi:right-handed parallel beta-helix repeat-containing protein [Kribbella sp. NPDC051137]|uniref:right-handed parallel beta-helix repeat-containing protein n=1 Tax=Kribbella sp. NPDC051137 TaxID=3155045 RepID=UPI003414679D
MRTKTVVTLAVALGSACAGLAVPAQAAGTTYYVDNRVAGCDDSGAGTSSAQPWCGFTPITARTFAPGDRILLARGASWRERAQLQGTGRADAPITFGAYGSGDRPLLLNSGLGWGIRMINPSHWQVSSIEVDGSGTDKLDAGIQVRFDGDAGIGNEDLRFSDVYVHHNQIGIAITGTAAPAADQWAIKDLTMARVEGAHNEVSIAFGNASAPRQFLQETTLTGLFLHNDDGAPAAEVGCANALTLQSMTGVLLTNSVISDAGGCPVTTGTTGVYVGNVANTTIMNNIIVNTDQTASPDQTGVDLEGNTDSVALRGNYIGNNVGWGVEDLAIHATANTRASIVSNAIVFNGKEPIATVGSASTPTGSIGGNLWQGSALLYAGDGGSFDGFWVGPNPGPVTSTRVWYAARDWATGQGQYGWRYEYSGDSGTTWSALTYQPATEDWRPAAGALPLISKWNWHPAGPGSLVARSWTAPTDGTVAIAGQAAKGVVGGDGVRVRILDNSTTVVAPTDVDGTDLVGIGTDITTLQVQAGDVIRFAVDAGSAGANSYDTVNWTPVIGYL